MKTIRIRRGRPGALAASLALLLTMIFVLSVILPALPGTKTSDSETAAAAPLTTSLRVEALEVHFDCHSRCDDPLQARIHAAQCIEEGGAGLILTEGKGYAIVCGRAKEPSDSTIRRSAAGLTMALQGSAAELAAAADAIAFLRAQATETGALAGALEGGETDAASILSLIQVYRTQGQRVLDGLALLPEGKMPDAIRAAVRGDLSRLADSAASPSGLRLMHAAACAEWIGLLEALTTLA